LPVAEPEARPRPRVRGGSEAAVERAGAATRTGAGVIMKMVEPVEMPLPSHPHILPRCDLGEPQTRRGGSAPPAHLRAMADFLPAAGEGTGERQAPKAALLPVKAPGSLTMPWGMNAWWQVASCRKSSCSSQLSFQNKRQKGDSSR
jgi:hypothetical protein